MPVLDRSDVGRTMYRARAHPVRLRSRTSSEWSALPGCDSSSCDRALLAAIAVGDEAAFGVICARYERRIARFVRGITGRYDLVDEITNETLWAVWRCAARFRGGSEVSTWIMGIARNLSRRTLRRLGQYRLDAQPLLAEEINEPPSECDICEWVGLALAQLPVEQRTVLELSYRLGYSCREIAERLKCPVNTVKTRMYHGRRKLRHLLPRFEGLP
jgi:RNA polymerase sigma-70 factor, ECF subfamily